jgi:hypothetical protein
MNKSELIEHLKQGDDIINKILEAAQLPLDLPDYSPEQVQVIEAIAQLVSSKQSKSYQEAGEVYRKPIREGQLTEAASRHQIAPERIPEILSALKLKPETLTDAQLEQFAEVCAKLQSGIDLAAAVPAKATRGKKAAAVPEFVPQTADEDAVGGAIALATPTSIASLEVSEADQATLRDVADAAAKAAITTNISDKAAELAVDVVDQIDDVLRQMIVESIFGENSQVKPDPDRAAARVREIRAQRGQR